MAVYAVAQLSIHDRERYMRYVAAFMPVLNAYGGRLLAADDRPDVLEGEWQRDKVVIVEFPDAAALDAWANSPEYRAIALDRIAATDAIVLKVQGVN